VPKVPQVLVLKAVAAVQGARLLGADGWIRRFWQCFALDMPLRRRARDRPPSAVGSTTSTPSTLGTSTFGTLGTSTSSTFGTSTFGTLGTSTSSTLGTSTPSTLGTSTFGTLGTTSTPSTTLYAMICVVVPCPVQEES